MKLTVRDFCHGEQVAARAIVMQQKTQRPVQFEITPPTRDALQAWIKQAGLRSEDFPFPSRIHDSPHLGTRQYARILEGWIEELGLDTGAYGTHSIRRTKPTLIYRRTKNLRAAGEHRPLSRHRGGRRAGNGRADRGLRLAATLRGGHRPEAARTRQTGLSYTHVRSGFLVIEHGFLVPVTWPWPRECQRSVLMHTRVTSTRCHSFRGVAGDPHCAGGPRLLQSPAVG